MKKIPLSQGQFAIVDNANYNWLNRWKWTAVRDKKNNCWYAFRRSSTKNGLKSKKIWMHRLILDLDSDDKRLSDHINHNGLDNRISNLRTCTPQQNQQNQRLQINKSSRFKGVCFRKRTRKWRAYIQTKKTFKSLGCFKTEELAALAYDMAAIREHGEFAHLNFN